MSANLPINPLARLVAVSGGVRVLVARAAFTDAERRRLSALYRRGRRMGALTPYAADELAVRLLGLHPALVWGERWWVRDPMLARQLGA
jgi:hypothetical protein